ncbi:MAG: sec-independent protein translocase protein TatC, partial [Crocinitomicaceae bacterium]
MEPEKKMSFLDHLEELRWRIVKSAIVIVIFAVTLFSLQTWIMENLFLSMQKPSFITFRLMCQYFNICVESIAIDTQSIEMTGQFSYSLMMSIMGGFVLASPFIFFQIWSFVKPGLKQNEKGIAGGIVVYVSILFFLGIS